ncbi:MAG: polyphosphate kinase 1 [Methanomassiliicoccus sp.]|nr:polyphosphate kinase 1 [Methanomassiliicoccus sp.]
MTINDDTRTCSATVTEIAISEKTDLPEDPKLYINRELSWLNFNHRIFDEAACENQPLLERVKFLAICGSNLDEFFMVRVPGICRQVEKGALEPPLDGLSPQAQIKEIRSKAMALIDQYSDLWNHDLVPKLWDKGIRIRKLADLDEETKASLREYFESDIFPALTPLVFDISHPFPFISSSTLSLAVVVIDPDGNKKFARLKIPIGLFPRFVDLSQLKGKTVNDDREVDLILLEDLIAANMDRCFPGLVIEATYPFRVTRDAELLLELDEESDLLTAVEEGLETRKAGLPSRLEIDNAMPSSVAEMLANKLGLSPDAVYRSDCPLGLVDLWQLHGINRQDLKDIPFIPNIPASLSEHRDVLGEICHHDEILYHPYDSFQPIVNLIRRASRDPDVLAIKITLYRIDVSSPMIEALVEARHNQKAVSAVVELKARFDEQANIGWARRLEHAGVHVVYGLVNLKVHAKMCLIVRRTKKGIVRICHLSSGNYNAQTARTYGDLGYITCDPDIAADVSDLFNALTGLSRKEEYRKLLVSPFSLRRGMLHRISREIQQHRASGNGRIAFKLNALIDKEIIDALYRASVAGVKIDLNIRGMCCLRPGIKGISENIRVTSIVGRFLEHSRIYYFRNGGNDEILLGSSDLMPRNLNKRIEILFPVQDERIRKNILDHILQIHLDDNVKGRWMKADGSYERMMPKPGGPRVDSQEWMIEHRGIWHG